ncbi:MAG TPA: PIG-L family deacetylase [Gemmatimonadaceae bacterium]
MRRSLIAALSLLALVAPRLLPGQERGATALRELTDGLSSTVRVLVIGAHPDDEDTQLITWLARGHRVETAYLSLTRGDGGQNLLGNELGEALGAIRTEELLAARRIDGAAQYFGRAYDFGFSKNADEAFAHWPHDTLLSDVLTVVRRFRPHVIVSVFSGTPRDGHGQHQVAGILAREAFDLADDTVRVPRSLTANARGWRVLKFYRSARFNLAEPTLTMDVGEYSPLLGESYGEIAAQSRSQHKSQAFGSLQRKGPIQDGVRLEATHIAGFSGAGEKSLFDGIDTTWARLRSEDPVAVQRITELLPVARAAVRAEDYHAAARTLSELASIDRSPGGPPDRTASMLRLLHRATDAALLAAGVAIEATTEREQLTLGDDVTVNVTVYNRGVDTLHVRHLFVAASDLAGPRDTEMDPAFVPQGPIAPGGTQTYRYPVRATSLTRPAWLASPRIGDMFATGAGEEPVQPNRVILALNIGTDEGVYATAPIVYRYADPLRGEIQHPVAVVPPVSITLGTSAEYVRANAPVQRVLHAELRSGSAKDQTVRIEVAAPAGLRAAPIADVNLPAWGTAVVDIELRGTLAPGAHPVRVTATANGQRYTTGYTRIDYPHINPRYLYRDAVTTLQAVDIVAPKVSVAYIPGVGDNVAPTLAQLGVDLTVIDPAKLAGENLARFNTVVVGPRAYESSPALVAANGKLLDYVKQGGRLVAQYEQNIMTQPGIMPYPITLARPADRVTDESAPVRMIGGSVLTSPNRISAQDFAGWVQERALYMPRTFDPHYGAALEMNDPGETPNRGAILVAPYGRGTYVYTTLSLFRQLPAGVPGAARLMLNILAADAAPRTTQVP